MAATVAIRIAKAVGTKDRRGEAPNDLKDVQEVQKLLNLAFGKKRVAVAVKAGDKANLEATILAIKTFQALCPGLVNDGRVDPAPGKTIGRLNDVANPHVINSISQGKIKHGGYIIAYAKKVLPTGYKVFLGTDADKRICDVTTRNAADVLGSDNLPTLLKNFETKNLWGKKVGMKVSVYNGTDLVTSSDPKQLSAPLKPYSGSLGKAMFSTAAMGEFVYSGLKDGRYAHEPAIDGKYYFAYNGLFELDPIRHGFNCITFVGAVYDISPDTGAMNSYGTKLAEAIKVDGVDMEAKKEKDIKTFFETHAKGTYVMWSEKHMVVVHDAVVHEFWGNKAGEAGGYRATKIADWNFHGRTYWVRKPKTAL